MSAVQLFSMPKTQLQKYSQIGSLLLTFPKIFFIQYSCYKHRVSNQSTTSPVQHPCCWIIFYGAALYCQAELIFRKRESERVDKWEATLLMLVIWWLETKIILTVCSPLLILMPRLLRNGCFEDRNQVCNHLQSVAVFKATCVTVLN